MAELPVGEEKRSRLAVASFVLGILSFVGFFVLAPIMVFSLAHETRCLISLLCLVGFIAFAGIPVIIKGYSALSKIEKNAALIRNHRMARAGLTLGCTSVCLTVLFIGGVWDFGHSMCCTNETCSIGKIRDITEMQIAYRDAHGVYAGSIAELTTPGAVPESLSRKLEWIPRNFTFTLKSTDNGNCYEAIASPIIEDRWVLRFFFSDCSGVIRWNYDTPADSTSIAIGDFKNYPKYPSLTQWWRYHFRR